MTTIKKISLFILTSLLLNNIFSSCSDDINLNNNIDNDKYENADKQYLALKNYDDPREMRTVELRENTIDLKVYIKIAQASSNDVTGNLEINATALDEYNTANSTDYDIFPTNLVTISTTDVPSIPAGKTESNPVTIKIKKNSTLEIGKSYILPISFKKSAGTTLDAYESKNDYLFIIKYMGDTPNVAKASGIVTIMYFEVNDVNPLNAGEYTLKNSGKPLADIVTIFAANINYNRETGRVYINSNENISHILANREKYIKPLQDKGIKVTLSILGNHDGSGVANLSESTAKEFARELKATVDAYGLDGIEFDDEYSDYYDYNLHNTVPGFVPPSRDAYARLAYETKKIMPDKIVNIYHLGYVGFPNQVDGVNPADFIDYTMEAYYGSFDSNIASEYLGMTNKQVAPYSRKIVDGLGKAPDGYGYYVGFYDMQSFRKLRNDGYGANMLYNFNPKNNYTSAFNDIANILYDDDIVFSGNKFEKDW